MARAQDAGPLVPIVDDTFGGLGLDHLGKAIVFEAAGTSPLGPPVQNIAAPDEGSMHYLEQVGTDALGLR